MRRLWLRMRPLSSRDVPLLRGRCACGGVTIDVKSVTPSHAPAYCHCNTCRRDARRGVRARSRLPNGRRRRDRRDGVVPLVAAFRAQTVCDVRRAARCTTSSAPCSCRPRSSRRRARRRRTLSRRRCKTVLRAAHRRRRFDGGRARNTIAAFRRQHQPPFSTAAGAVSGRRVLQMHGAMPPGRGRASQKTPAATKAETKSETAGTTAGTTAGRRQGRRRPRRP